MGSFSIWHWLIVGVIILLLFGRGRISEVMGEMGKGIKSFKKGISEEEQQAQNHAPPRQIPSGSSNERAADERTDVKES